MDGKAQRTACVCVYSVFVCVCVCVCVCQRQNGRGRARDSERERGRKKQRRTADDDDEVPAKKEKREKRKRTTSELSVFADATDINGGDRARERYTLRRTHAHDERTREPCLTNEGGCEWKISADVA